MYIAAVIDYGYDNVTVTSQLASQLHILTILVNFKNTLLAIATVATYIIILPKLMTLYP